jgi:putative oxidoreductase
MNFALLLLHLVVGAYFAAHGAQKLFGSFGGNGLEGTSGFFESTLNLRPGRVHATAAGLNEFVGGVLLALGLLVPLAAVLIVATMVAAIQTVHAPNGPFASDSGYELNVIYIVTAVALAGVGAGEWGLDHVLGLDLTGTAWAVGVLVVGVIGGLATVAIGRAGSRQTAGQASA